MADLLRSILTGIGALTLIGFAIISAIGWLSWRRDRRARNSTLPPAQLPDLSPEQAQRLLDDLDAFEKGETP